MQSCLHFNGLIQLAMYVEEICLSAAIDDLDPDQRPDDPKEAAALEQFNWMRRCRSEFTLFNNHNLWIKTQGLMEDERDYMIDVGLLDPNAKRSLKIAWGFLLIFGVLCSAAWLLAVESLSYNTTLLSIILITGAGLSLILSVYSSHDRLVFYSRYGRVPLVVLLNRSSDSAALHAFTDALMQHIKDTESPDLLLSDVLSEELKAHRRLMEEGIITSKRYNISKQRILRQHSSGSP
jgi:hypothetical protein